MLEKKRKDIESKIKELLYLFKNWEWLDFEVSYSNGIVVLAGESIAYDNSHDIEIFFDDICFMSTPFKWTSEPRTTPVFMRVLPLENWLVTKFDVIEGDYVFEFFSKEYPEIECYIGASDFNYKINPKGDRNKYINKRKKKLKNLSL